MESEPETWPQLHVDFKFSSSNIPMVLIASRCEQPSAFVYALITMSTPALLVLSSILLLNHRPEYMNYTHEEAGLILGGVLTIVTLFQAVTQLIPHARPLPQILGV